MAPEGLEEGSAVGSTVWVFAGNTNIEKPRVPAQWTDAASALAGGPERTVRVKESVRLYAVPVIRRRHPSRNRRRGGLPRSLRRDGHHRIRRLHRARPRPPGRRGPTDPLDSWQGTAARIAHDRGRRRLERARPRPALRPRGALRRAHSPRSHPGRNAGTPLRQLASRTAFHGRALPRAADATRQDRGRNRACTAKNTNERLLPRKPAGSPAQLGANDSNRRGATRSSQAQGRIEPHNDRRRAQASNSPSPEYTTRRPQAASSSG